MRRLVGRPIDLLRIFAGTQQRQAHLLGLAARMGGRHLGILGADIVDIALAGVRRQQRRHNADGAAGIRHVDRLALVVARMDLDGRMDAAGRRAADQQRQIEPCRSISAATCTISSSDGVIRPERPMISTFSATAVSRIFVAGTMTPRSMIS